MTAVTAVPTINSKSTKADVVAAYEALTEKHEKFRKTVVRKARAAARDNGWCEVVEDTLVSMGLDDLLPPVTVIQSKNNANDTWDDASDPYDTIREGRDDLRDWRNDEYHMQSRRFNNADRLEQYVSIRQDTDIEKLLSELRVAHSNLQKPAEFTPSEFPKFRLVQRTYKGDLIRVVDEGGGPLAPRA